MAELSFPSNLGPVILRAVGGALVSVQAWMRRSKSALLAARGESAACAKKTREYDAALAEAQQRNERAERLAAGFLSRQRHDILGDLNIALGFTMILKPTIMSQMSVTDQDYFNRAIAGLQRAIAAAEKLKFPLNRVDEVKQTGFAATEYQTAKALDEHDSWRSYCEQRRSNL